MALFKKKKNLDARRFDINQTLVNTTYQPSRPATPEGATDPRAISVPATPAARKRFRWTWKKSVLAAILLLISPLVFIAAWDARNVSNASEKMFGSGNLVTLLNSKQAEKSNDERVNILIIGNEVDKEGHGGAKLTDTIMILSLSTDEPKGYMLSVPRDLYVPIEGYGEAKINEAYQAGGADLLRQTVQEAYGIPIQYHVLVSFNAVKDTVEAVDGVTVNIKSEDPRGLYDPNFQPNEGGPLKLKNGKQEINGQTALKLSRARGSTYGSYGFPRSDFDRTNHQRQIIKAIKEKINWKFVLDPRINSKFFDAVADNVKTDIDAGEVLSIYRLFNRVPEKDLESVSLHDYKKDNYYSGFVTPTGQSAVIPAVGAGDFSQIQSVVKKLNRQ